MKVRSNAMSLLRQAILILLLPRCEDFFTCLTHIGVLFHSVCLVKKFAQNFCNERKTLSQSAKK